MDNYGAEAFNIFAYSPMEENISLVIVILFPIASLFTIVFLRKFFSFNKNKPLILFLANFLFLFFFLSSAFLIFELYFRFLFDSTDSTISTRISRKWFRKYYHTNRSGFRDSIEYLTDIPKGKRRITFIGDSFTAGHGVQLENRFANLIRNNNPDLEIHVIAIPGWNASEELDILKSLAVSNYSFDIVALVFFINDIDSFGKPLEIEKRFSKTVLAKILRYTYFGDYLVFRIELLFSRKKYEHFNFSVEHYKNIESVTRLDHAIQEMKDIVVNNNGVFCAIVFPLMDQINSENTDIDFMHLQIDKIFSKNNIPFIDLRDSYRLQNKNLKLTVNSLDTHPNENAHLIAAEEISKFLGKF